MRIILILIFIFSINLLSMDNKKVVLQLKWLHQFQFAGYYIAKEHGFYADVGIDLEIREYTKDVKVCKDIITKKVDFAVGRSSIILEKIKGKNIVALGAIFQSSPMMLLVRADSGINEVKDLHDKKVMISNDTTTTASTLAMLNSNGVTRKDIKVLEHSFNLDDLINGKTDAMSSYLSNEPIMLESKNIKYKIFHPKDHGFDFYSDILFSSAQFIKDNPTLTKNFYEATIKGWQYAFNNITETSELIFEKYNTQNKSLITFIKEGEILKKLAYVEENKEEHHHKLGYIDKNKLKSMVDVYKVLGLVHKDLNTDEFIYEFNHPKTFDLNLSIEEVISLPILLILILSVIFYFIKKKRWLMTKYELESEIKEQKTEIENKNRLILVQSKIAAVGEMLSNIAHQWRQPLSSITASMASVQLHHELGEKVSKKEFDKIILNVNTQCQYLSKTIDDFRYFFDENSINTTKFNLKEAILKAIDLESDVYKNNFIKISTNLYDCEIEENQNVFIQSLLNIFNNAKDSFVISEIPSEHRYFFIKMTKLDNEVQIKFTDSGNGIDEDIINNIFEPYFTTKHKSRGTGIGLYMTHQIITRHLTGTIEVKNVEYEYEGKQLRGAEFKIKLPLI